MESSARSRLGIAGLLVADLRFTGGTARFGGADLVLPNGRRLGPDQEIGIEVEKDETFGLRIERPNAFVNTGLQIALDRLFGLGGSSVSHLGVSSDNTAVTAGTTTLGGTPVIKAISPAASRTNQTVTAGATFTQADVAFVIRKVGLLTTSTDAGTGLIDVIGGSGSAPYNQPFTIDLTGTTTWTLTMQIQVTAQAV